MSWDDANFAKAAKVANCFLMLRNVANVAKVAKVATVRKCQKISGNCDKKKRPDRTGNGILFWPTVRKNCSSDREKYLKFEAEGREFAKSLRLLEQFIPTVQW